MEEHKEKKKPKEQPEPEPPLSHLPPDHTKLRIAESTLEIHSDSEESLNIPTENVQKYQMYLGGYAEDQKRKAALAKKAKLKAIQKVEKTIAEGLNEKTDLDSAVITRKPKTLLVDGTFTAFDEGADYVFYHNPRTRVYLIFVFILMETFGVAFLTLVPIYSVLESGTIETYIERGYKRRGKTIHYTIGALWIFIFGNGFIIFRITSAYRLTVLKWIHALVYAASIPLPMYCVNSYYNVKEENKDLFTQEHYYSLHSFFGFLAVYLYIFEVCCGFLVYTVFFFKQIHRNIYYQIHTYVSLLGFVMAISTFVLGITMEELDIEQKVAEPIDEIIIYLNLSGIFVCIFAILSLFLIINPDFDVEKDLAY